MKPTTWHAHYCREAWRLYDLVRMATGDFDGFDPVVLRLQEDLAEHLKTCTECKREKPE